MEKSLPKLYSFRRCPYAIRARLGLYYAEQPVEHNEVTLRNKPTAMLAISPKGTVPVLQLPDGTVLEESLDIIFWALRGNDPQQLLPTDELLPETQQLIAENDGEFKHWLDRYKYAVGYPEQPQEYYREQGGQFLKKLEQRLAAAPYLAGSRIGLADIAVVPFVRQFAHVDKPWFDAADYPRLQHWLADWLSAEPFLQVMAKANNQIVPNTYSA